MHSILRRHFCAPLANILVTPLQNKSSWASVEGSDMQQDARQLWQSAVDKLQAVISADPSNASALRAAGLALMDLAALPGASSSDLLQVSHLSPRIISVCRSPHALLSTGRHLCTSNTNKA